MLAAAVEAVTSQLTAAGVVATGDPRDLNLPGAWVEPSTVEFDTLAADQAEVTLRVHLVVPDNGPMPSMDALGDMLMIARRIGYRMINITTEGVTLQNHGADPLPALSFDVAVTVSDIE